jgi:serine/threonine protein kinase
MLMPRYLDVFERCPHLDGLGLRRLWAQMKVALDAIHAKGFAHMDIKPANICMREGGDFILIDLGSVQRFGIKTHSTPSYVPKDLWADCRVPVIASSAIDWWMLAVCIAEKACEPSLRVGGSKLYTCAEIETHLCGGSNLPEEVVSELRAKLNL